MLLWLLHSLPLSIEMAVIMIICQGVFEYDQDIGMSTGDAVVV